MTDRERAAFNIQMKSLHALIKIQK